MRRPEWRLVLGASCAAAGLLAVFPAPTYRFWMLALGVTEWGHFLALLSLAPLWPGWSRSRGGRAGAALGTAAALLALSPQARARAVAEDLPERLSSAFPGSEVSKAWTRDQPFSAWDMLRGIRAPVPSVKRRVYAAPGGAPLEMDIYSPSGPGPHPGLLVVHGGSWSSGVKGEFADLNAYLAGSGYLVADMDYRLAPQAPFPAALEDVRTALAYLKARAPDLDLDPGRLALVGRSAGGQLALLAAYADLDPAVRGVIAFYAPNDLVLAYSNPASPLIMDSKSILEGYLGGPPERVPGLYEKASPLGLVGPKTPPTLIIHGLRDELVWKIHSERLEAKLAEAGRPHLFLRLPWATHGCDYNLSGPCGQLSLYAVERFLASVL